MKKLFKFAPFLIIIFSVCVFFYPFLVQGKLPIPADTITGLYYPFRDLYSRTNPNGLPYKNFLITDPVRQQYPWKNLAISLEKNFQVPLWNPYEMAGTPLLSNFQSSVFYPLNILLFVSPFELSWSFFIMLEPILMGLFLYLYLKNLKLDTRASILGAVTWMFCGFSIAWLEWGTIIHTALWMPLILLSIDKGFLKQDIKWKLIFILSLSASLFAGHVQTFFYIFVFTIIYFGIRVLHQKKKAKIIFSFVFDVILFLIITSFQWISTLQFINLSNRSIDVTWTQPGWFIPYQNLIQFIVPDFFGNPATLNYFGVWNYGEFIGYMGLGSLVLALYAMLFRHDKKTWFFMGAGILALLFATQNPISQLPYLLKVPFIATAQPTRLMFIVDICLAVLAALGLDYFLKSNKRIWVPLLIIGVCIFSLWVSVIFGKQLFQDPNNILTAKSNLKLPSILFIGFTALFLGYQYMKNKKVKGVILVLLFILVLFDLFRFGWKFTPFVDRQYLYPDTKITSFLQKQPGIFRIAATDSRIFPPNFSVVYKLQSIEGYDPLYLSNYAMFIAASQRLDHSIKEPYGFNRIITPRNLDSQAIDFLNVKYVLSLTDLHNPKFKKVMQVGETRLYENLSVLPRAYFVEQVGAVADKSMEASLLFGSDLSKMALVEESLSNYAYGSGTVHISQYSPNRIQLQTVNEKEGFLVLSDTYYPSIHATIDGQEHKIIQVNLAFRGLVVPAGKHTIVFEAKLF